MLLIRRIALSAINSHSAHLSIHLILRFLSLSFFFFLFFAGNCKSHAYQVRLKMIMPNGRVRSSKTHTHRHIDQNYLMKIANKSKNSLSNNTHYVEFNYVENKLLLLLGVVVCSFFFSFIRSFPCFLVCSFIVHSLTISNQYKRLRCCGCCRCYIINCINYVVLFIVYTTPIFFFFCLRLLQMQMDGTFLFSILFAKNQ